MLRVSDGLGSMRMEKQLGDNMLPLDDPNGALTVKEGVSKPNMINEAAMQRLRHARRRRLTLRDYVDGILSGSTTILSQAITLLESVLPAHHDLAQAVIAECLPHAGNSFRIGITGVPGAGKSTIIEELGELITAQGRRLAVLAIDPSSAVSRGSILGDKTRMEKLSINPRAFIRPSPAGDSLGGVARKSRETIILCEAAGYDTIFIETVGVGQSETAVHSMVDVFLLVLISGAGDELQGIKRGIMEMADILTINKADGQNVARAQMAKAQYQSALHLFPASDSGWIPQATTCSAYTKAGLPELWGLLTEYLHLVKSNGYFARHRNQQSEYWMMESIHDELRRRFNQSPVVTAELPDLRARVLRNELTPFVAAQQILDKFFAQHD